MHQTFSAAEVAAHNTAKSCWVTVGNNVYDVTDFVEDHPGGADLLMEYAGRDVGAILKDADSHEHSEAAYDVLQDSLIGVLAGAPKAANGNGTARSQKADAEGRPIHPRTGMSRQEDLYRETDAATDYEKHRFLDLSKPLLMQVWNGGFSKEFYLDQVHRPRHCKGGKSAPLFGNFLEPLSLTPWWVVPMVWCPPVAYGVYRANEGLFSPYYTASLFVIGWCIWSLAEYGLHRFLFHIDRFLPDNRAFLTLHFLLHGIHHYLPMDKMRLVMPPALFAVLATPWWHFAHFLIFWDWYTATAVFSGAIFGYICYDLTHYFLHHENLPLWYKQLKKYHLQHHFLDYENGFGVTSRFWDRVFGTELVSPLIKSK